MPTIHGIHGSSARESFHRDPLQGGAIGETQMAGGRDLGRYQIIKDWVYHQQNLEILQL